jgi:signal peptidase I
LKKEIFEWVISIVIAVALVLLVNKFVANSYSVSGLSMHPTFDNEDRVIVSKISKTLNHLNSGDVIVFHEDKEHDYIKRLIGTPGDIVKYKDDKLYVNDKKIDEPYLKYNKKNKFGDTLTEDFNSGELKGSNGKKKIPKGRYLVLGDNRQNSIDSRRQEVGLIKNEQIVGKVVMRFWPLKDITFGFNPSTF